MNESRHTYQSILHQQRGQQAMPGIRERARADQSSNKMHRFPILHDPHIRCLCANTRVRIECVCVRECVCVYVVFHPAMIPTSIAYMHVHTCVLSCTYIYIYIYMYVYIYTYIYIYIYMYICIYTYVHTYVCIYMNMDIYTYIYIYIYLYM